MRLGKLKELPLRLSAWVTVFAMGCYATEGSAATGLAGIATQVMKSFKPLAQLMIATSYLAGIGFVIASIFKFKQHKDNPTQIPLGTPIALMAVGVALIFLPNFITPAGESVFGSGVKAGGFTGAGVSILPT